MSNIPYGGLGQQLQQHAATLGAPAQPHLGQPGVVAAPLNALLPQVEQKTVPFEAAAPGSLIAVFAPGFSHGERCKVIKMQAEWGPTRVPALHLISEQSGEMKLLPSTVQGARIEVLVSAEQLGIERAPEDAIRARMKPLDLIAMQWKGGAGEAAKFILWATGHISLAYDEGTETTDEYLLVQKLDQTASDYMRPGDWLVKHPDGEFRVVDQETFAREFEEVSILG